MVKKLVKAFLLILLAPYASATNPYSGSVYPRNVRIVSTAAAPGGNPTTTNTYVYDVNAINVIPASNLSSNTVLGVNSSTNIVSFPQMGTLGLVVGNGVGVFPSTAALTAGSNITLTYPNGSGGLTIASTGGGGGGSSNLAISTGTSSQVGSPAGTFISSPTAVINFNSGQFFGSLQGGSTAFISLNPVSLSTGVTGSLPAASIAAGSLGSGVIASSVAAQAINSSNQIVNGTIVGANLANNTITNTQMSAATYSNITVPAANVAAGNLGATVIASSVAASGVGASSTFGNSTNVGQFTVGVDGRITAASNVAISASGETNTFASSKTFTANVGIGAVGLPNVTGSLNLVNTGGLSQWTSVSTVGVSGLLFFQSSSTINASTFTNVGTVAVIFSTFTYQGNTLLLGHSLIVDCDYINGNVTVTGGSQIISLGSQSQAVANTTTAKDWIRVEGVFQLTQTGQVEPIVRGWHNLGNSSGGSITVTTNASATNLPLGFDATANQTFTCNASKTSGGDVNFRQMSVSIL